MTPSRQHVFLMGLLLILLAGCGGITPSGPPGGLDHTEEVTNIFESTSILPDHDYYYSGPEAEPEAIIGIMSNVTFQGRYWHKVDLTAEQLQSWNRRIDNSHRIRFSYRGAWIVNPEGQRVGVWYSKYDHTAIYFPEANTIFMRTPDPPSVRGCVRRGFPFLEF